ncbi:GGDEF domain-containing protein [Thermodesulfitimonas sp.]
MTALKLIKYGHLAGDVLLQNVAKAIRHALRQEDVVVRYGGDEFAVILTGADARSAMITAERLRNTVKSTGVSMSLRVVTYPQDGTTAEELLRRADYYLLAAKALQGRTGFRRCKVKVATPAQGIK